MSTTVTMLPSAKAAMLVAARAAERERLLTPDVRRPDVPLDIEESRADRTLIGRRIAEEHSAIDRWSREHVTRERRREIEEGLSGEDIAMLTLHGDNFRREEPPLRYATWSDTLDAHVAAIVGRRASREGCPVFALWQPAVPVESRPFPPVRIVPPTSRRLASALRRGERHLTPLITAQEAYVTGLRRLAELVAAARSGAKLTEEERAEAYAALLPVETVACSQDDVTIEDRISDTLGLYFGVRILATGGTCSTTVGSTDGGWHEEPPSTFSRDTLMHHAERYGLAKNSPPIPPLPTA